MRVVLEVDGEGWDEEDLREEIEEGLRNVGIQARVEELGGEDE